MHDKTEQSVANRYFRLYCDKFCNTVSIFIAMFQLFQYHIVANVINKY